jgi:DNA-binding PadR family transcriptional regulator
LQRAGYGAPGVVADEIQDKDTLERLVLSYVTEHPTAADTIDGVRLWWLREAGTVSPIVLRMVLDELLKRGWLVARGNRPETRIYSLNERERDAVKRFIQKTGKRRNG